MKESSDWLTMYEAIAAGLIKKADGSTPKITTVTKWCVAAMKGDKRYFRRPNGRIGVKKSTTGRREHLIHRDALPFNKDFDVKKTFSAADVRDMRLMYEETPDIYAIAARFGTSYDTAYKIVKGLRR